MATLVSVTALILTGTHLSSFAIFTLLLGFATLGGTLCYNLGLCMQITADGKVAIDRMQNFLMEKVTKFKEIGGKNTQNQHLNDNLSVQNCKGEEKTTTTVLLLSYKQGDKSLSGTQSVTGTSPSEAFKELSTIGLLNTNSTSEEPCVSITEASCSWNREILSNTLSNITLNVYNGKLLAITGAVGSGKSSLLTAILGELPLHRGSISYHGKIAYVPQVPWVFSGTIRENILFGFPFNEERFRQVVHVCELTKDLTYFANGDLTEIGQRGVTLSGGQKARVGLARAVYSDADIYLFDDPLRAVDTKVGRRLFESCILGHLSGRIRLLATHQLQYLKDVDRVVVIENGSIIHQGLYTEILDQGALRGVAALPEHCEDRAGLPHGVVLRYKGYSDGKVNEVFEEDDEAGESNTHEKERVDQKLSKPLNNGPCVVANDKGIMEKVLIEDSVKFVGEPPEGEDNETFVHNTLYTYILSIYSRSKIYIQSKN